jgi:uncharacterized protein YfaS (alpha-2-macroglobulin family)
VTGFRVLADGFTRAGTLGTADALIESIEPFYLEPKMPLELTSGDEPRIPVALVNNTDQPLEKVRFQWPADVKELKAAPEHAWGLEGITLEPGQRFRELVALKTDGFVGAASLTFSATAAGHADRNTRKVTVKPLGFPAQTTAGGLLQADGSFALTFTIPEDRVARSIHTDIRVFPSPVGNMTAAMGRLIREPSGCFEQTSSTSYPLVMAQQYFTTHQGVDPALIQRSAKTLRKGYDRLVSFECHKRGYEWFGQDPGHEALTAYGLMQFVDMGRVMQVDREMVETTRKWLMNQRDGEGGFNRGRRALHTWVVDKDCSNGYILWSLLATGNRPTELKQEIDHFRAAATESDNSYVVALAANVMHEAGDLAARDAFIDRLYRAQQKDGHIAGATTSIVGSGGKALTIETTALAQLAMLHRDDAPGNVEKAHKWLAEQCEGGRYGSTQSTVLAIKAIVAYDQARARPEAPGHIVMHLDGKPVGKPIAFDAQLTDTIELPDIGDRLEPGEHTIELRMEDGSRMPFAISIAYHRTQPDSSRQCRLRIDTALNRTRMVEGEVTEARVKVRNIGEEAVPTPIAIVGIPAGLEVRHDQLKELRDAGTIASYEVIGREVVLYWRQMNAGQTVELPLSLIAAIPGTYTAPASRAYLYYTDEHKHWTEPLAVTITAR